MMETSGGSTDHHRSQSTEASGGSSRRYRLHFSPSRFIQARLSAALELFGVFRARGSRAGSEELIGGRFRGHGHRRIDASAVDGGEVSIRIVGAGDPEGLRTGSEREGSSVDVGISSGLVRGPTGRQPQGGDGEGNNVVREVPLSSSSAPASASPVDSGSSDGESNASGGNNNRDALYQRYDIQQVARWIEQILPFSLLLLVVFIRQHLQGTDKQNLFFFFLTICLAI